MREIKFRAVIEYELTISLKKHIKIVDVDCIDFLKREMRYRDNDGVWYRHFSTIEAIIQFTGLKDKKGKEIYEGDIIKIPRQWWHKNWKIDSRAMEREVVEEPIGNNLFESGDWSVDNEECEVIGNIYENPELIK